MASGTGMITFQLHRLNLLWLLVLALLLSGLIFTLGLALGSRRSANESPEPAAAAVDSAGIEAPAAGTVRSPVTVRSPGTIRSPTAVLSPTALGATATVRAPTVTLTPGAASIQPPRLSGPTRPRVPTAPTIANRLAATAPAAAGSSTATVTQAAEESPPIDPLAVSPPAWAVQVGAFLAEEEATKLLEELQERGYQPVTHRLMTSAGQPLLSVRLGPFPSREHALEQASKLSRGREYEALIVRSTS